MNVLVNAVCGTLPDILLYSELFSSPKFSHTGTMKISILGSGTSHGIPVVGCDCPVCRSEDPRDKRMRTSAYIEGENGERALIDAGPEFRLQAVRAGIKRLDGIFLTHAHADHVHGLDDIRPLCRDKPIPVYGNEKTITEMRERFSYVWAETQRGGGKPRLIPIVTDSPGSSGPIKIGGLTFTPIPVKHGILDILGWEVEDGGKSLLYLTDTSAIPGHVQARFGAKDARQPRVIIIGGLRIRPHETHFGFDEALKTALGLGAKTIYLTHICHDHSHAEIEEFCLNFRKQMKLEAIEIHPAHDGLEINL